MKHRCAFVLSLAAACGGPSATPNVAPTIPTATTEGVEGPKGAAEPQCPGVDLAQLEPPEGVTDPRRISLLEVFPREQVRAAGAAPLRIDVGTVAFNRALAPPPPRASRVAGMGWQGLAAEWVEGGLTKEVVEVFGEWLEPRRELFDQQRAHYLLGRRVSYLRVMGGDADELGCAIAAEGAAAKRVEAHRAAVERAAERLVAALRELAAPTASDKLLLGYLLEDRVPRPRATDGADVAEPLRLFDEVAGDAAAPRELRARAAERRARALPPASDRAPALERVLALTEDPNLRIETSIKLAAIAETAELREKRLVEVVTQLEQHGGGWRLAQAAGSLAELRLERGAFALAVDEATRCARASGEVDDPDPWGCAPTLAEALAELGGADAAVEVPLAFLGPLARASMTAALARSDHDQARHVGKLLLARLPEASEAARVLDLLIALERDPAAKQALADRRARDYDKGSAWLERQRERLARKVDADRFEAELARLTTPPPLRGTAEPSTPAELEAQLHQRARQLLNACEVELSGPPRDIGLRIDTTGSTPTVVVSRGNGAIDACLRRAVTSTFRSVPPATIAARLVSR